MERFVRKRLIAFLEKNNLLTNTQHGFHPGRSCLTQLLQHFDWVLKQQLNQSPVDVIYLNFAKTFDKVDHSMICHKMQNLGITGKLGEWLHDFPKGRSQTVVANGAHSQEALILSEVPQGTVLGPLLFVVALSDMPPAVQSANLTSYAVDIKVSQAVRNPEDVIKLQKDLNEIYKWANRNSMQFNAMKFQALHYRSYTRLKSEYTGLEGNTISESNCLDYCSQLQSPESVKQIVELKAIQHQDTKKIDSMQNDGLLGEATGAESLFPGEKTKEICGDIYIWKILEGVAPNFGIDSYTNPFPV
eukprot:XP_014783059.1 PREDICTED: RNA-directed DNA polymerase from mobile element jockey-like [Octopus bimaculoides]